MLTFPKIFAKTISIFPYFFIKTFFRLFPVFQVNSASEWHSIVSVSPSHVVGRGFAPQSGHTKPS